MTFVRASALASVVLLFGGCAASSQRQDVERMGALQGTYQQLHVRLEKASQSEPLLASAFADHGQVIVAIRSGLIEELAGNVAQRYLDNVTVDLNAVKTHTSGEIVKQTFLGRIKIGDWNVNVDLGNLVGQLRAGTPRVGLRAPDLIDIDLPVDVLETLGDATLRFNWDSAALANAVCRDFELTRRIQGRVLTQKHRLIGALRLQNTGDRLTATPVFPDPRVDLKLDLTPKSWAILEQALRSQNTLGKCGMLMKPDQALGFLRGLAAKGISVRLPKSIFRTISLPARLQESVNVNHRPVGLAVKAESLRIETATLWSSASVQVQVRPKP